VYQAGAEFAAGGIHSETQAELAEPLYPCDVFEKMADASWGSGKDDDLGTSTHSSLNFTVQMAALYRPDGVERVLEICYTDIGETYQVLLTKKGSEVITDGFKKYTTRIETPYSVWRAISRGEISGQDALFQRKYKVLGDFDLMVKWNEVFGAPAPAESGTKSETKRRKTNMSVLLLPWLVIWIAMAIDSSVGGVTGIISTAFMPLLWLFFQPVIFEQISVPIVTGLSLAALFGVDPRIIVPLSYAAFGVMWIAGSFARTPLTAYYSAKGYGEERAFSNSLFIRTNRILTAAWGVLYLVTPIWTYFLMGTNLSVYTGLINTGCPALMGVFTVWFQKWYPAWWARG